MHKIFDRTVIKFAFVGVINTLVGTAVMFSLYNFFHCDYWISSAANYVVGSIVSYVLNKNYTFNNHNHDIRIVFRFIINVTICYLLAYGIAKPAVLHILSRQPKSIQENTAMLVGMGLFMVMNYFGQRFFAFK